jgi:hypothetical protein
MIRILQTNLNRCRLAQDLLEQTAREKRVDVLVVSEPNKSCLPKWYADVRSDSAIHLRNSRTATSTSRGEGWVRVKVALYTIYSCYFSPNRSDDEYAKFLSDLETDIRAQRGNIIVAGDFNAKSTAWGCPKTSKRGAMLEETMATCHLHCANEGRAPTFLREHTQQGSIIDITLADESSLSKVMNWRVLQDHTHSDHRYITYELRDEQTTRSAKQGKGWCVRKMDEEALLTTFALNIGRTEELDAIRTVERTSAALRAACNASMPRRRQNIKTAAHWWNDEIADLRKRCVTSRRWLQRTRGRDPNAAASYRETKILLSNAIRESKKRCWEELVATVDEDPWGLPYRLVRKKLIKRDQDEFLNNARQLNIVVDGLFPETSPESRTPREDHHTPEPQQPHDPFTLDELKAAIGRLGYGKAPGPDGIPNEVLRLIGNEYPETLLNIFNKCLQVPTFHNNWKRQKLVLIPKPGKQRGLPSSYRPLCMMDGLGKLMERLILSRLTPHLEGDKGLSDCQHGFRKGRSTTDALQNIVDRIRSAWEGSVKRSRAVVMISLDIKNAFNTACWEKILNALHRFEVPEYLQRIIQDYLGNRVLEYACPETGAKITKKLTAGVPQGSVLGPALWNAMYDDLLRIPLPEEAKLVAFADDVTILVTAKSTEMLELVGNRTLRIAKQWLVDHHLELAIEKTEAVLFSRRRSLQPPKLVVDGFQVPYSRSMRCLGVWIDDKLGFGTHTEKAAAKASAVGEQLARLMPNIGGPRPSRRRLYSTVVNSTLMYGAPIWSAALQQEKKRATMARVQRNSALRTITAYRTVSEDAATTLACSPPIHLVAEERRATREGCDPKIARRATTEAWQRRWEESTKGRWTHRLIPNIESWCGRKHGDLCFHLTQLMTGHGCFGTYLHRLRKEPSERCHHCDAPKDDAEHTAFHCPAWEELRQTVRSAVASGRTVAETMVPDMLHDTESWNAWQTFAKKVMTTKETAERERQASSVSRTS